MPLRLAPALRLGSALGLAVALLLGTAHDARAEEAPQPRTMTISGTGQVTARPDIAYIESGVVSDAPAARDALAANTAAMMAIFAGLEAMKIEKDDIQTSEFSVSPVYTYPPARPDGTQDAPILRGYRVANQVTVTIRKLDELGAALDQLVSLGSNRLNGIRFAIEKPEPLLDRAREDAVADALRKAKLYAGASGVSVGQILSISEGGGYTPQPVFAKAMAAEASSVPVAPGTQTLSANVSLTIEIQ